MRHNGHRKPRHVARESFDWPAFAFSARTAESAQAAPCLLKGEGFGAPLLLEEPFDLEDVDLPAHPSCEANTLSLVSRLIDQRVEGGVHAVGFVSYEAGRALEGRFDRAIDRREAPRVPAARFVSFRKATTCLDRTTRSVALGEFSSEATRQATRLMLRPVDDAQCHLGRVKRALTFIEQGDIYQVNLARAFETEVTKPPVARILELGAARFAAGLHLGDLEVTSLSPEMFLTFGPTSTASSADIFTLPMKGTRPRYRDPARDAEAREALIGNEKERAELTMIVDLERNDLGKISVLGSVVAGSRQIQVDTTVFHAVTEVSGRLRDDVSRGEAFAAMFPSGSVTGAPKGRAMEIIASLEPVRRGLYTGAFLHIRPDGSLLSWMAIRTLVVEKISRRGTLSVGGGIVEASDPQSELEETEWKARQISGLGAL